MTETEVLERMIDKYSCYEEYYEWCADEVIRRNCYNPNFFDDPDNVGYYNGDNDIEEYRGTEESMVDFIEHIGKIETFFRYRDIYIA